MISGGYSRVTLLARWQPRATHGAAPEGSALTDGARPPHPEALDPDAEPEPEDGRALE